MCSCGMLIVLALSGIVTAIVAAYYFHQEEIVQIPENGYWGKMSVDDVSKAPKDDTTIKKFTISVDEAILSDLKERLSRTRFTEPLEDAKFQYGFNSNMLRKVVAYWAKEYDWRKEERLLNSFDQYTTQIEGINVHFIHVKPKVDESKVRVIPLLMVHGWPGSIVEFTKIIPLLTQTKNGIAFEMVCPSIPGYGFSEAPHKKGFNVVSAARVFVKLMERLGHKRFYVQGGDWGGIIASSLGAHFSDRLYGVHTNFLTASHKGLAGIKLIVGFLFPQLVADDQQASRNFPYPISKLFSLLLRESGYMHIQSTKPDTVGSALTDSPAGLAAYILEKYSSWTDFKNIELEDGGLTEKYTLDHLLTNVMVYWVTNSITPSMRLYKEFFSNSDVNKAIRKPVTAPAGIALFPNELAPPVPRTISQHKFHNIITYSYLPRGGHFAAMEEPELLEGDIRTFVEAVEAKPVSKE